MYNVTIQLPYNPNIYPSQALRRTQTDCCWMEQVRLDHPRLWIRRPVRQFRVVLIAAAVVGTRRQALSCATTTKLAAVERHHWRRSFQR
jgi:hypothetical protein